MTDATVEAGEGAEAAAAPVTLERIDEVAVIRMRAGENRFNPTNLDAIEAALAALEANEGGATPVVLTGEGKFFANGLDLDWMSTAPKGEPERVLDRVHALLARILGFPALTVAAINGHAFAAGGMLALALDQRVMRADRGYFCLPEVDIGVPFTDGMSALIAAKLTPAVANESMVTGRRYGAGEAVEAAIVDEAVPEQEVLERSIGRAAAGAGNQPAVVAKIKRGLYARAVAALEAESA